MSQPTSQTAVVRRAVKPDIALHNAIHLWADAATDATTPRRRDLLRDKQQAVLAFFIHTGKRPAEVTPMDVKDWQAVLEVQGLAPATVYARISRLSSFYAWAMREPLLGQSIKSNPALLARPRAPRAYQTRSVKALNDDQLRALLSVVKAKAATGDIVGKRDYALLLFYVTTGMRRSEVISLRGKDVETREGGIIIRSRVKGGDYVGREIKDQSVKAALMEYLRLSNRTEVLVSERPLWTRHDWAGRPGAPLTSHAFAKNLKRYALQAGIGAVHLHQTRHTYARMVAEATGSITETQDALGHRNLSTTRAYVQRIGIKRDKHSEQITKRLGV